MTAGWGGLGLAATATLAGVALGAKRPAWLPPAILVTSPLRLGVTEGAEISTLLLVGGAIARSPAIVAVARARPTIVTALLLLPSWFLLSGLWARQPLFAGRVAAQWAAVALAALVCLADPRRDPRPLLAGALLSLVPSAAWGFAEWLEAIPPLGLAAELELRLIITEAGVRGKALFYHPNRLAEFVEQVGLFLIPCAAFGPWRIACGVGLLLAGLGVWGTGSAAGIATMIGGGGLVAAVAVALALGERHAAGSVVPLPRGSHRAALRWIAPAAVIAAVVVVMAWQMHGGIGPRAHIYSKAWQVIVRAPALGLGGGGWPFEVAGDPVGRFWFASHAHSLPLQVWVEGGFVGLCIAIVFFGIPLWGGLSSVLRLRGPWRGVVAGACAGVAGLLAHDLVHYFLREAADGIPTGLLLGLAAGGGVQVSEPRAPGSAGPPRG